MRMLKAATADLPEDHELRRLWADARALLDERNQYVHGLVVYALDPEEADGEPGHRLHHPRSGVDVKLPTLEQLEDLARRIIVLTARSLHVARNAYEARTADSSRTEDHS